MIRNRKFMLLMAVITLAGLLLSGTFAWQQMVSKTNEFIGQKTGGITVHDDFDPATGAKDVYAENPNNAKVYVRAKLDEAMNLQSNTWRPGVGDWQTHTYEQIAEDCLHANGNGDYFHNYFTWEMGGQKYYLPADGTQPIVQDTKDYSSDPNAKLTPNAGIIHIWDYIALPQADQDSFVGWIYDVDGYAYWSQPLRKGEVTGLLLHKVHTSQSLTNTDYYYAIDVKVEAVDDQDIPMWTTGAPTVDGSGTTYPQATQQGVNLINQIITR